MSLQQLAALPRPVAFVLPGGGALGAYQVGILHALTEADVAADMLIGVSAGAVNAALFAWNPGLDGIARVEQVWRSLRRRDLLRLRAGRAALALAGRRTSFLDNRDGLAFLRRHLGHRHLEDAPIPLSVVATDLATGRAVALSSGDAALAVTASSAFPGVYPPVEIGGRTLIDGGVVADIPLDIAKELGAASAIVITVPALAETAPPTRAIEILFRASTWGVEAHGRTSLARPPAGLKVVEVPAPPSPFTTFAVGRTGTALDDAYASTKAWLAGG